MQTVFYFITPKKSAIDKMHSLYPKDSSTKIHTSPHKMCLSVEDETSNFVHSVKCIQTNVHFIRKPLDVSAKKISLVRLSVSWINLACFNPPLLQCWDGAKKAINYASNIPIEAPFSYKYQRRFVNGRCGQHGSWFCGPRGSQRPFANRRCHLQLKRESCQQNGVRSAAETGQNWAGWCMVGLIKTSWSWPW